MNVLRPEFQNRPCFTSEPTLMDKETTPRSYSAWKASIDDAGCVCRMEPIWETMIQLEKDLSSLQRRLELAAEVCNDRIKETEATGDVEWTERNKHVARILGGILSQNVEAARPIPGAQP